VHDLFEFTEIDGCEFLPLGGDDEGLGAGGGFERSFGDLGSLDEIELEGLFRAFGVIDGDLGAFFEEVVDEINRHGAPDIVGIGLEGEAPDGDFFVLQHPERFANFGKETLALGVVDFFDFLKKREGNAEVLADGDEGGDVFREAGSSVADTGIEEIAADALVRANAVGDFFDIRAAGFADAGDGVDVGNLEGQKGIGGIGSDKRIGRNFLNAGIGYGGSCFPKDIAAFIAISEDLGVPFTLLKEVEKINHSQRERFLSKIRESLWVLKDKKIAVWGLAFKPDTDDVRCSVAIDLVNDLLKEGAEVTVYDPKGTEKALEFDLIKGAKVAKTPLEAATGAEALIIATEWKEFTTVDLGELKKVMHTALIFDGRNLLNPDTVRAAGFQYTSIGRS